MDDCFVSAIVAGAAPASAVYEVEAALAFMDLRQANPGHVLVIPRTHVELLYDLDAEIAAREPRRVGRAGGGDPSGSRVQRPSIGHRMMKIALVSTYDIAVPSGVNGHVAHLAQEFRGRGHDVRVIAPGPPGEREPGTITMGRSYPFPAGGSLARVTISPWLGLHVKRLLARERFDVIHIHEPLTSALTLLTLHYARAVTVGTFHAARERGTSRGYAVAQAVLRRFAARLDGRIAVSPAAARLAARYFPGDYEVIPNGVDLDRFATPLPCPPALAELRPYVLFVGRFEDRKGLPVLLESFGALRARRPGLSLVVAGDGRRRERYEREAARLGPDGVLFAGRVPGADLPAYYQHAAVYCAPNTGNESFGIVLLEAMAAGCPVVASRIEGFAAVVRDGVDGLLVPPRDPAALAEALDRAIGDRALTASLTARGRCRAREFDWPRIAERVLAYYARLLDERRGAHAHR